MVKVSNSSIYSHSNTVFGTEVGHSSFLYIRYSGFLYTVRISENRGVWMFLRNVVIFFQCSVPLRKCQNRLNFYIYQYTNFYSPWRTRAKYAAYKHLWGDRFFYIDKRFSKNRFWLYLKSTSILSLPIQTLEVYQ